jgi:hypothetical protein
VAKASKDMSFDELAQEMCKRPDSLDHLTAKAEITRRQTEAQLEATHASTRNANYMLASVIIAAVSALASALTAFIAFLSIHPK